MVSERLKVLKCSSLGYQEWFAKFIFYNIFHEHLLLFCCICLNRSNSPFYFSLYIYKQVCLLSAPSTLGSCMCCIIIVLKFCYGMGHLRAFEHHTLLERFKEVQKPCIMSNLLEAGPALKCCCY
uniref:Uncharacterized protein n=1 Tax=Rhipicephalus zambeziensis TaxID=60191 RepID=A0A224YF02_9ACAR